VQQSDWTRNRQNLRQAVLAFSRSINHTIVVRLNDAGFHELKATHTALLSSLELDGSTITECAARAGISKQAMGRLAADLRTLGYIDIERDPADKRNSILRLTPSGLELMQTSFSIMSHIEAECAATIGQRKYRDFIGYIAALNGKFERS
jgi:DNA-binding MarR family transcriptional regulator